jgi:hypothetical protein
MKLSDLLEDEDRLMAHLEPLPFQEGKPLATTAEESTELVEASSDELISRQVLMAEEGEDDGLSPNETLGMISEDESTANVGNENDTKREARRARNRARAARRRRVNERIRSMHSELDAEFAVVSERGFRTPVANIARVTAILERSNDPNLRQALRYAQKIHYEQGAALTERISSGLAFSASVPVVLQPRYSLPVAGLHQPRAREAPARYRHGNGHDPCRSSRRVHPSSFRRTNRWNIIPSRSGPGHLSALGVGRRRRRTATQT